MNEADWRESLPKFVRILQIIVAALVIGSGIFLGVVLVFASAGPGDADRKDASQPLIVVGFVFLAGVLAARYVMTGSLVRAGRRRIAQSPDHGAENPPLDLWIMPETLVRMGDPGRLFSLYQQKTIIGAAWIEGAAFFFLILALVTNRNPVILTTAIALIMAIALHMPTCAGVVRWIEDQLRLLEEERSMGR